MMLCHDLDGNSEVIFTSKIVLTTRTFFNRDVTLCNNGVVTIGTCFTIVNPKPIRNYFSSDIPLGITNNSVIVLRTLSTFPTTSINNYVIKNVTWSFCIEQMKLKVTYLAPAKSICF